METIKVALESKLLKATDQAAKRRKMSRPALIRHALQEHLKRLHMLEIEKRDRRGYQLRPQKKTEIKAWEDIAEWPEDFSLGCG